MASATSTPTGLTELPSSPTFNVLTSALSADEASAEADEVLSAAASSVSEDAAEDAPAEDVSEVPEADAEDALTDAAPAEEASAAEVDFASELLPHPASPRDAQRSAASVMESSFFFIFLKSFPGVKSVSAIRPGCRNCNGVVLYRAAPEHIISYQNLV